MERRGEVVRPHNHPGAVVADTDVIIDFLNGREPAAGKVERLLAERRLAIAAVPLFELRAGVASTRRLAAIDSLCGFVSVIPFSAKEAAVAAELYTLLKGRGKLMEINDLLIGATALASRLELFTGNVRHFSRLRGLRLWDADSS